MERKTKPVVAEKRRPRPAALDDAGRRQMPSSSISPCALQTEQEIEAYYRNAVSGDVAVVRETQYNMLVYKVTDVEGTNPQSGRTYIRQHGAFYMKSGKNCFHPKGQTSLVVPTPEVLRWAEEHPQGEFGYVTFTPEQYASLFKGS